MSLLVSLLDPLAGEAVTLPLIPIRAMSDIVSFGTTPINALLTDIGLSNCRTDGGVYSTSTVSRPSVTALLSESKRKSVSFCSLRVGSLLVLRLRDRPGVVLLDLLCRWR